MAKNQNPVIALFLSEAYDPYDPWGSAVSAHFDIAECLYRNGADVPAAWEFRPSPVLSVGDKLDEDEASMFSLDIEVMLAGGHYANLIHAGTVLGRYSNLLKLAGKSH